MGATSAVLHESPLRPVVYRDSEGNPQDLLLLLGLRSRASVLSPIYAIIYSQLRFPLAFTPQHTYLFTLLLTLPIIGLLICHHQLHRQLIHSNALFRDSHTITTDFRVETGHFLTVGWFVDGSRYLHSSNHSIRTLVADRNEDRSRGATLNHRGSRSAPANSAAQQAPRRLFLSHL